MVPRIGAEIRRDKRAGHREPRTRRWNVRSSPSPACFGVLLVRVCASVFVCGLVGTDAFVSLFTFWLRVCCIVL